MGSFMVGVTSTIATVWTKSPSCGADATTCVIRADTLIAPRKKSPQCRASLALLRSETLWPRRITDYSGRMIQCSSAFALEIQIGPRFIKIDKGWFETKSLLAWRDPIGRSLSET